MPPAPSRRLVHGRGSVSRGDVTPAIDVVGDVHGSFLHLEGLLDRLGYVERRGRRRHPEGRKAVFVGDLIDRGPGQLETVRIVRGMLETGDAACVMGNHEYNAVAWYHGLRRKDEHRRRQHAAFLDAVGEGSALHRELVEWFATLPLVLEIDGLRIVHACWDPQALEDISGFVSTSGGLTEDGFTHSSDRGHADGRTHRAVEHLLKGPEIELPAETRYVDKDGKLRSRARYAWWNDQVRSLADACVLPHDVLGEDGEPHRGFDGHAVGEIPCAPYTADVPVVVGHYWRSGVPEPLAPRIACVDYSAVRGGALCAYRYDGETTLLAEKFVTFDGRRG